MGGVTMGGVTMGGVTMTQAEPSENRGGFLMDTKKKKDLKLLDEHKTCKV